MTINNLHKNRAFTLIELLVVISVIGLLSTVVLASLNSARDKATIAAGKQFDSSTYHAYGADAIAYWNLNEISSGKIIDYSGNNFDLTVADASKVQVVPGVFGNAITFLSNYTNEIPLNSRITVPTSSSFADMDLNGGTLSLWVNASSLNSTQYAIAIMGSNSNRLYIRLDNDTITVIRGNPASSINLGKIKTGEWVNIALTWSSGSGAGKSLKGYVNGKKIAETTYTEGGTFAGTTYIQLGNHTGGGAPFINGTVDEIRMYNVVLADSDIRSQYIAGLDNLNKRLALK